MGKEKHSTEELEQRADKYVEAQTEFADEIIEAVNVQAEGKEALIYLELEGIGDPNDPKTKIAHEIFMRGVSAGRAATLDILRYVFIERLSVDPRIKRINYSQEVLDECGSY